MRFPLINEVFYWGFLLVFYWNATALGVFYWKTPNGTRPSGYSNGKSHTNIVLQRILLEITQWSTYFTFLVVRPGGSSLPLRRCTF
jgi:hypothetical protein